MERKSRTMVPAAVTAAIFFATSGIYWFTAESNRQAELHGLRYELLTSFYQDIDRLVDARVKGELARAAGQGLQLAERGQRDGVRSQSRINQAGDIARSALGFDQARKGLSDETLESVVAGDGVEPNVKTAGGFTKEPMASGKKKSRSGGKEANLTNEEVNSRPDSIERTLQQRGSVLLPKGKMQIEPGMTYAHFSSNRLNIDGLYVMPLLIGEVSTESVNRDVFIQTIGMKYGLMHNFQLDLRVPFREEYDRIVNNSSATTETRKSAFGLGDIEMGFSRQIGWEQGLMPDLIASLSVKTPSGQEPYNHEIGLGTGHWAVRGALVAAKSSDPAVVFGSLNYTYNFQRDNIENYGDVKPGDSVGYSLGVALALSYQTALTFSFDQSVNFPTVRNGQTAADSFLNSANLKLGLNWALSERQSVNLAVSEGLTKDSPDMSVELSFPYQF